MRLNFYCVFLCLNIGLKRKEWNLFYMVLCRVGIKSVILKINNIGDVYWILR